jgi:hypothetical protein
VPLSAKHALLSDTPEMRIKQFKAAFGDDLDHLDAEFVKYMARIK